MKHRTGRSSPYPTTITPRPFYSPLYISLVPSHTLPSHHRPGSPSGLEVASCDVDKWVSHYWVYTHASAPLPMTNTTTASSSALVSADLGDRP